MIRYSILVIQLEKLWRIKKTELLTYRKRKGLRSILSAVISYHISHHSICVSAAIIKCCQTNKLNFSTIFFGDDHWRWLYLLFIYTLVNTVLQFSYWWIFSLDSIEVTDRISKYVYLSTRSTPLHTQIERVFDFCVVKTTLR